MALDLAVPILGMLLASPFLYRWPPGTRAFKGLAQVTDGLLCGSYTTM